MPRVGIAPPASLVIYEVDPDSPAAVSTPGFEKGDEIVSVNGESVADFAEFSSVLVRRPNEELKVTVRRGGKPSVEVPLGTSTGGELVEIVVPPRPMKPSW
jgi:S1-C subfamily serine protease